MPSPKSRQILLLAIKRRVARASSTGFAVPLTPSILCRQPFSSSWPRRYSTTPDSGSSSPNLPQGAVVTPSETDTEAKPTDDAELEPLAGSESTRGRARTSVASGLKNRQARRREPLPLPPVNLPASYIEQCYHPHHEWPFREQRYINQALSLEAKVRKISDIYHAPLSDGDIGPHNTALSVFFHNSFEVQCEKAEVHLKTYNQLALEPTESSESGSHLKTFIEELDNLVRTYDKVLDAAWHAADAYYPARQAQYIYQQRPFWWWTYYNGELHSQWPLRSLDTPEGRRAFQDELTQSSYADDGHDGQLAQILPGVAWGVFNVLSEAIKAEAVREASATFDSKSSRRPINISTTTGYPGRAVSENLASALAAHAGLDLVRLDAYDLSYVVGQYLDQDWATSRGSLSMLGFRAAELGGRLVKDPYGPASSIAMDEDDEQDDAPNYINFGAVSSQISEDLRKIRRGAYDCFSKWDSLKIDKILDVIVRLGTQEPKSRGAQAGILLHVNDIVELNMTLEGSYLVGRIRALADAAWQQGHRVVVFGTSSVDQASEEYQNMVRNFTVEDFVVSRHLTLQATDRRTQAGDNIWHMDKMDAFVENMHNIERMVIALDPVAHPPVAVEEVLEAARQFHRPGMDRIRHGVLPLAEVYNIASGYKNFYKTNTTQHEPAMVRYLTVRGCLGNPRHKPGNGDSLNFDGIKFPTEQVKSTSAKTHGDAPELTGLTEYEKRVSGGIIDRRNVKTTFADVHVPKETTSTLKLLTSLALTRPDAFSYGVLATDKISGCLLYGPPGTGKTMLAKAVAKDSGANMLQVSGATINDKWVGESEKLIRAIFTLARKLSPCVVFIDEADSIFASRGLFTRQAHRELINQFLQEWDGIQETSAFIMLATNRPFDLDDAVLRRLPRKLLVDLPTRDDRVSIFKLILRGERLDDTVSIDDLADRTPYYSGSDIKNVCVAAAMAAVEEENGIASKHEGPDPYVYPSRRVIRKDHLEKGLKSIPASISEDMVSLKDIRKFDEKYGRAGGSAAAKKRGIGFGILNPKDELDSKEARIRQPVP